MSATSLIHLTALTAFIFSFVPGVVRAAEPVSLQKLIDEAAPQGEVVVPRGLWKEPLVIDKPLKLRGESAEACLIEVTSDEPALRITSRKEVVIESLTVRWQRATSQKSGEPQTAIVLRDSPLTLRSVRLEALGNNVRCPSGLLALGFSDVRIEQSTFVGFEFTIQFADGAKGRVTDSTVWRPGRAGITAGPDSAVTVSRCIVGGSAFHGIRCTGGTLNATDNLVVSNKNRGFYLGNKSASGLIRNNMIVGNATGISGFAQSEVEIAHNVIARSDYAGLDARDTCQLLVRSNIFLSNTRGLLLFKESGQNKNVIGMNVFWENRSEAENFEPAPEIVRVDPRAKNGSGDLAMVDPKSLSGAGPLDAETLAQLWKKWAQFLQKESRL